jgi:hypothetical protein
MTQEQRELSRRETMRKVIGGKVYDTDTAEEVCKGRDRGYSITDFDYVSETLYRTANGRWFLAGEGGPRTGYAESAGQNWSRGGQNIHPLSAGEALEWMEENAPADLTAEWFALEEA